MFKIQFDAGKAAKGLREVFKKITQSAQEALGETASLIVQDMQEPGKPVTYPIQWDSEKQRRAYFATNGFGKGIPYVRTGAYVQGWKKTDLPEGFEISNQHPAGAIGGTLRGAPSLMAIGRSSLTTWQSKIHRGRWKSFLVVAAQRVSELSRNIAKRLRIKVKGND